jgi:hypothetical protein
MNGRNDKSKSGNSNLYTHFQWHVQGSSSCGDESLQFGSSEEENREGVWADTEF